MHGWALAEEVIKTAEEAVEKNDAGEIIQINIKIGKLQQVDREVFDLTLEEIAHDTIAEGSEIMIEEEKAVLEYRACGKV